MPDRLTSYVTEREATFFQSRQNENIKKIEMLEADNFELRDEITRLTLHNATLRRMLKLQ